MNTGYKIKNRLGRFENGVLTQTVDLTSNPNATPVDIVNATGVSLQRATELVNSRVVLDLIDCPVPVFGTIQFESTSYTVQEPNIGVTNCIVTLIRQTGCNGNITATIDAIGGTALPLNDYTDIFPATITWLDGDCGSKQLIIPIVGDTVDELDETLILEITNLTAGSLGVNFQTTVTILDNDINYTVNVVNSNTSTCNVTGTPIYPYNQTVPQGGNITLPINTSCTVTAILVNGINQTQTVIDSVNLTGQLQLTNVQENITVEMVYGNVNCNNGLIWTPYVGNSLTPYSQLNPNNVRVVFKFKDVNNVEQLFDQAIPANDWQTVLITLNTLLTNDTRLQSAGYYGSLIGLPNSSFRVVLQSAGSGKFLQSDDIRNNNLGVSQYSCIGNTWESLLTAKEVVPFPPDPNTLVNLYY
jgi:hypothetical protein